MMECNINNSNNINNDVIIYRNRFLFLVVMVLMNHIPMYYSYTGSITRNLFQKNEQKYWYCHHHHKSPTSSYCNFHDDIIRRQQRSKSDSRSSLLFVLYQTSSTGTSSSRSMPVNEDSIINDDDDDNILPDMIAYSKGYQTVYNEIPFVSLPNKASYGKIPNDLIGTYYRVGPAMFTAGSIVPPRTSIVQPKQLPTLDGNDQQRTVRHPFDADGALLGITFAPKNYAIDDKIDDDNNNDVDNDISNIQNDDNINDTIDEASSSLSPSKQQIENSNDDEDDMEISLRYRFIRTIGFTNERKKGSRVYQGMDATRSIPNPLGNDLPIPFFKYHLLQGLNKLRKNTSNTRVIYWGKRLFTLWDGGQPYKIDDKSCYTDGKSRLGGAIMNDDDSFGQKMCVDPISNHAIFYGVKYNTIKSTTITIYEFDNTFTLMNKQKFGRQEYDIPGYAVVHDMIITKHYIIIIQPDVTIKNPMEFLIIKDPGKVLSINPNGGGIIHILPRDAYKDSKKYQKIIIPPSTEPNPYTEANVQFINAYEDDNDDIIIDLIKSQYPKKTSSSSLSWPWGKTLKEYQDMTTKKALFRYTINTKTNSLNKNLVYDTHCYFGTINTQYNIQKHSYIYMNIGKCNNDIAPFQGICKLNINTGQTDIWMPKSYEFCGEPMYAPKSTTLLSTTIASTLKNQNEDSGYIISILFNGRTETNEILIFNASNISNGPITRIPIVGPTDDQLDRTAASITATKMNPNIPTTTIPNNNKFMIPHGYFGTYVPNLIYSINDMERRVKLSNKIESRGNIWNEVKSDFSGLGLRLDDIEEYFGDFFG